MSVTQWGHDFRLEQIQLSVLHKQLSGIPRVALTVNGDRQTRAEIITSSASKPPLRA